MRKSVEYLFSLFVGVSLLGTSVFCLSSCYDSTLNGLPYVENDMTYLKYGSYPQTVVTNSRLISNLDDVIDVDSNGYYSYDDNEYAKLVAEPSCDYFNFSDETTKVVNGETYYFKVEPIKWRVIYENEGTYQLLSEYILDEYEYDDSSNNYMDFEIREWLNDDFYNIAFTDKSRIRNTLVDNSA